LPKERAYKALAAPRSQSGKIPTTRSHPLPILLKTNGLGVTISDRHSKKEISRFVRDGLAQQLTGILLAAKALTRGLEDRQAREAIEADRLVNLLKAANKEVQILLNKLR
jgi:hypothetical protein